MHSMCTPAPSCPDASHPILLHWYAGLVNVSPHAVYVWLSQFRTDAALKQLSLLKVDAVCMAQPYNAHMPVGHATESAPLPLAKRVTKASLGPGVHTVVENTSSPPVDTV